MIAPPFEVAFRRLFVLRMAGTVSLRFAYPFLAPISDGLGASIGALGFALACGEAERIAPGAGLRATKDAARAAASKPASHRVGRGRCAQLLEPLEGLAQHPFVVAAGERQRRFIRAAEFAPAICRLALPTLDLQAMRQAEAFAWHR